MRTGRHRQLGAALLLLLLTLLTSMAWLLTRVPAGPALRETRQDLSTLVKARDLLIARSLASWDAEQDRAESHPGALRCSDRGDDGSADMIGCSGRLLGRFPWRSLRGAQALRDSSGQSLWYAVAPELADWGGVGRAINSDTAFLVGAGGLLELDGVGVAAIIIAPGRALPHQAGRRPDATAAGLFLEGANADGDRVFRSKADLPFNDLLLGVRLDDYLPQLERLVLDAFHRALLAFRDHPGCGRLPWPALFDPVATEFNSRPGIQGGLLPVDRASTGQPDDSCPDQLRLPDWVRDNQWHRLVHYALATTLPSCGPPASACLSVRSGAHERNDVLALLISAGRPLVLESGPQQRPGQQLADYFETGNQDGDTTFTAAAAGPGFNDQLRLVAISR